MQERVARLVTRVRIPDPSALAQARCFPNTKEIDFVDIVAVWPTSQVKEVRRFPRLETLVNHNSNVCAGSFLAHLPRPRKLELCYGCAVVDVSPIAALVHLEHLAVDVQYALSLTFLEGLIHLESLVLCSLQSDLRSMPLLPRLKSMEARGGLTTGWLQGIERLHTIETLALFLWRADSLVPVAALPKLTSLTLDGGIFDLALLAHHPAPAENQRAHWLHSRCAGVARPAPTACVGV